MRYFGLNFSCWVSAILMTASCGKANSLAGVACSGKLSLSLSKSLDAENSESEIFLPHWNGLTGVLTGLNSATGASRSLHCRVYVEVLPPSQPTAASKLFLWKNPDCNPAGAQALYLAFSDGYVKTDFKSLSSVTDKNKFLGNSTLDDIYKTRWPISKTMTEQFGPWSDTSRPTDSFDPYGHIVEEIEFIPSANPAVRDFLSLAIELQVSRRVNLIPPDVESELTQFRNYFLNQSILKRLLIEYSQSSSYTLGSNSYIGHRYCSDGPWNTTPSCQASMATKALNLSASLSPELWAEIGRYFAPIHDNIDVAARNVAEQTELNQVIKNLFRRDLFQVRTPTELPPGLFVSPSLAKSPAFVDTYFSLQPESEYAVMLGSQLQLSATPHETNFLQLSGLQESDFCQLGNRSLFRPGEYYTDSSNNQKFFVGTLATEVSWAGIVPFARKRPSCAVCPIPSSTSLSNYCSQPSAWLSGGASILALPAAGTDEMMSEEVMQRRVSVARTKQSPNTPESVSAESPASAASKEKTAGVGRCLF